MANFLYLSVEETEGRDEGSHLALKGGDQNDEMNPGQQKTLIH